MSLFERVVVPLFEQCPDRAAWLDEARSVARQLGAGGQHVTINDVREQCPPPGEFDPRIMGAVFMRSEWRRVGFCSSQRATCHKRPISVFQLRAFQ